MKYSEMRQKIKSGDLIAFTTPSWESFDSSLSQMVRIFTKSEYSHVGIAWVINGRVFLLEAYPPRVRIFPLSLKGNFFHIPNKNILEGKNLDFALDQIGDKYSVWLAVKTFFKAPFGGDRESWHCAVYSHELLKRIGIELNEDCKTPSKLVFEMMKLGHSLNYIINERKIYEPIQNNIS